MVPGSDLLGGGETDTGFFYQFFFLDALSTDIGKMLEERMRQIVREDRPIRQMEMVAFSAKEMFRKAHHAAACDVLDELNPKEIVSIVRIGQFADLAEGPFCHSVRHAQAFQVTSFKSLGDGEYRVEGCVAQDKDELKAFLRKMRRYEEENHFVVGSNKKFWEISSERILWLPRGLKMREQLSAFFKQKIGSGSIEVQGKETLVEQYGRKIASQKGCCALWLAGPRGQDPEGMGALFEETCQTWLQEKIYCNEKEMRKSLFSLLQSIQKTLIILGFHPQVCLQACRVGEKRVKTLEQGLLELGVNVRLEPSEVNCAKALWLVQDGLGRPRIVVELEVGDGLNMKLGLERIIALLLELRAETLEQDFQF